MRSLVQIVKIECSEEEMLSNGHRENFPHLSNQHLQHCQRRVCREKVDERAAQAPASLIQH